MEVGSCHDGMKILIKLFDAKDRLWILKIPVMNEQEPEMSAELKVMGAVVVTDVKFAESMTRESPRIAPVEATEERFNVRAVKEPPMDAVCTE